MWTEYQCAAIIFTNSVIVGAESAGGAAVGELGDKAEGELKDAGGKLSGDKKMEWEGKAQKVKGDIEGAGREATEGEPPTGEPVEGEKGL